MPWASAFETVRSAFWEGDLRIAGLDLASLFSTGRLVFKVLLCFGLFERNWAKGPSDQEGAFGYTSGPFPLLGLLIPYACWERI